MLNKALQQKVNECVSTQLNERIVDHRLFELEEKYKYIIVFELMLIAIIVLAAVYWITWLSLLLGVIVLAGTFGFLNYRFDKIESNILKDKRDACAQVNTAYYKLEAEIEKYMKVK